MRWRLCWCAWSLWRHSRAMRTFLMPIHHETCLFARSFWLNGSLTLPVFGLEPSLCWVAPFKSDRPSSRPSLSRKEKPSSRWPSSYLVCREAHKENNSLRAPVEVEVEVEKKRPWRKPSVSLAAYPSYVLRTLGEPTAVGILGKENCGVPRNPPFSHPCGLLLSISHPCGMIVQTANLVDS